MVNVDTEKEQILNKMLKKGKVGGAKVPEQEIIQGFGFASHTRGKAKQALDELVTDPNCPFNREGRERYSLGNAEKTREYVKRELNGEPPEAFECKDPR